MRAHLSCFLLHHRITKPTKVGLLPAAQSALQICVGWKELILNNKPGFDGRWLDLCFVRFVSWCVWLRCDLSAPIRRNVSMMHLQSAKRIGGCKSRIELLHKELHARESAYSFFASYLSAAAAPLCYLARLHCAAAAAHADTLAAINLLFLSIVGSAAIKSVCVCTRRITCVVCTARAHTHTATECDRTQIYIFSSECRFRARKFQIAEEL